MDGFIICSERDQAQRLPRRLFSCLRACYAMTVSELCQRVDAPPQLVRSALERLRVQGLVERIRPVGYAGDDLDAYALLRTPAGPLGRTEGRAPRSATRLPENHQQEEPVMSTRKTMMLKVTALVAATVTVLTAAGDQNSIVVDGSTTLGPIAKAFAEYYMSRKPQVNITVSESGSGNGAKSLINAACDVATMSRPMKNSETKAAKDAGVLPIAHVVAMDGIAIVVHPSNPLQAVTVDQLRAIYTGKIANWKDLGGPDLPIVAISRDTNSGTFETFETLVMNREKMAPKIEHVGSNGAMRQRVMSTPAAIGYVGLAFVEGLKPVRVNGVAPSPDTVRSKAYPISRPLYMYTNGRPREGTPLAEFVGLARTPEGKRIVEDTGFVPVE